jgi:hypothetical protein
MASMQIKLRKILMTKINDIDVCNSIAGKTMHADDKLKYYSISKWPNYYWQS